MRLVEMTGTVANGNCLYDAVRLSYEATHGGSLFPHEWGGVSSPSFRLHLLRSLREEDMAHVVPGSARREVARRLTAPRSQWAWSCNFGQNEELLLLSSRFGLCIHVFKNGYERFQAYVRGKECISHTEEYLRFREEEGGRVRDVWVYEHAGVHFTALVPLSCARSRP